MADALRQKGHEISASGVRKIWQRHDLETTYKRLKTIERTCGSDTRILSDSQRERLRRGDRSRRARLPRHATSATKSIETTKDIILRVAAQIFVEQGYAAASLRDIGHQAGLAPGSLYHRFSSKRVLFVAVHHAGFQQLTQAVRDEVRGVRDTRHALQRACCTHAELMLEGGAVTSMTAASLFSRYDSVLQRQLNKDRSPYEAIFRRLISRLTLPSDYDRKLLRLALLGALNWALIWYRRGRLSPSQIAQKMVVMLCAR